MKRTNVILAACFLLLGLYLTVSSFTLPAGLGRLPGAGFFPQVIGVVTMILAGLLLVQALRGSEAAAAQIENRGAIAAITGLSFLYLLLWGTGFFALRTAVFLMLFVRLLGERWKASVIVAAVLTIAVVLAFQIGLRVSLE